MIFVVNRFRFARLVVISLAAAFLPAAIIAAERDTSTSHACQSIEDDVLRLACYDNIILQPQPQPPPPTPQSPPTPPPSDDSAATESPPVVRQVPLSDDVGREALDRRDADMDMVVRGRLVKCPKNTSGKMFFYFKNGQIWKKKGSTRVSWKNCSFDVTIRKDYFGYKMVRDGEKRYIRIARVK